jgi:DNA-binding NtrC family response regulator
MNARIMIVEDDNDIRYVVKLLLEKEGWEVAQAPNLAELRKSLAGPPHDVVILDLQLPDGDGLTVLPEIKQSWPKSKVIVLTGHGTVQAAETAYKLDDVYFESKPVDPEILRALVEMSLGDQPKSAPV